MKGGAPPAPRGEKRENKAGVPVRCTRTWAGRTREDVHARTTTIFFWGRRNRGGKKAHPPVALGRGQAEADEHLLLPPREAADLRSRRGIKGGRGRGKEV